MLELEKNLVLQAIDMRETGLSICFIAHIFFSKYYNLRTSLVWIVSLDVYHTSEYAHDYDLDANIQIYTQS